VTKENQGKKCPPRKGIRGGGGGVN